MAPRGLGGPPIESGETDRVQETGFQPRIFIKSDTYEMRYLLSLEDSSRGLEGGAHESGLPILDPQTRVSTEDLHQK